MSSPLITIDVESLSYDAVKLMVERNIGALVVTDRGEPVGIITDRDIFRRCCLTISCKRVKVGEIMSKPLITVDGGTPINKATKIMSEKKIRRLLVTEESKIAGIITQKDLMRGTLFAFQALSSS
jgi:CBS domain-containing protein